jgi:hypothetical protein
MNEHERQTTDEAQAWEHPIFVRVKQMPEPWRSHFPKSTAEANAWTPRLWYRALASRVLVVAITRIEGRWRAMVDAVDGVRHDQELIPVREYGAVLDEAIARAIFPGLADVPYAE